jgi:hypothetical protein
MSSVTPAARAIHLGMDTSKNTIVVGVLMPGREVPVLDRIANEEGSVRHLVACARAASAEIATLLRTC